MLTTQTGYLLDTSFVDSESPAAQSDAAKK